ncbi:hypothetical protein VTJ49DRAFT_2015 [Mycothermus thermophilus]|uniref:Protein prenyltransferase n=1 Tax=Humicola insolens TaxID=85995 RepID=A0ABR3VAZ6_HUMIN
MSRALDPETITALNQVDPEAAYREISETLAATSDGLLEIEILSHTLFPQPGQFVLRDGRAIGVSKLGLVQAFMFARKQLRDHLDGTTPPDADVLALTGVILLFDPEYLTAANTRKRLLQARISSFSSSSAGGGDDDVILRDLFKKEFHFVDTLLTSRLHRHTKSPTLWSHRRWLVTVQASRVGSINFNADVLKAFQDVVFVAGERHPRNYYAWCHARFLVGLGVSAASDQDREDFRRAVFDWCRKHHTDISGWSFLWFLLDLEREIPEKAAPRASADVFSQVLDLSRWMRPVSESVWWFLRTVAASGLVSDILIEDFLGVHTEVLAKAKDPVDQAVLRAAVEWYDTHRCRDGQNIAVGDGRDGDVGADTSNTNRQEG